MHLGIGLQHSRLPLYLEVPLTFTAGWVAGSKQQTLARDVTVHPGKVTDLGTISLPSGGSLPKTFVVRITSIDGGSTEANRLPLAQAAVAPPARAPHAPPPLARQQQQQQQEQQPHPPPAGAAAAAAGVPPRRAAIAAVAAAGVEADAVPLGHAAPAAAPPAAIRLRIPRRPAADHVVAAPGPRADEME